VGLLGIQVGLLQVELQDTDDKIYYCNLTATRREYKDQPSGWCKSGANALDWMET